MKQFQKGVKQGEREEKEREKRSETVRAGRKETGRGREKRRMEGGCEGEEEGRNATEPLAAAAQTVISIY